MMAPSSVHLKAGYPIQYPESFGLVLVEAILCGTPVAAMNLSAVPEILEPGVTGYHAWESNHNHLGCMGEEGAPAGSNCFEHEVRVTNPPPTLPKDVRPCRSLPKKGRLDFCLKWGMV
jgi:Glycosyl transferases group 1